MIIVKLSEGGDKKPIYLLERLSKGCYKKSAIQRGKTEETEFFFLLKATTSVSLSLSLFEQCYA